jgi:RHS repeat-associated protein
MSYVLVISLCAPLAIRKAEAKPASKRNAVSFLTGKPALQRGTYREGELIIRFREGVSEEDKNALVGAKGARRKKKLRGQSRVETLELSAGQDMQSLLEDLRYLPAVDFVEPNYLLARDEIAPNDPRFSEQWALKNSRHSGYDINAPAAWERTTGAATTVIAVIDSGIDFTHPDLAQNRWTNRRERENGSDDDRNGFVDDLHGWNWVGNSSVISDEQGHGTAVAGIIAAQGDNATGISGVMWHASLMNLKVLDNTGTGDAADAIEAIDYATEHGAHIINCSWGTNQFSAALRDAIDRAGRAGVVVVCSAGNAGSDLELTPYYPASFGLPNVISVAATDEFDQLASWSNYGSAHATIAAPGTDILTTQTGGGYRTVSGTSASAPLVVGVAGLIKTQRWWLAADSIITAIKGSARRVTGLSGRVSSEGVVDASAALASMPGPLTPPPGSGNNGNGNGNGQSGRPYWAPPPPAGHGSGGTGPGGNFNTTPPPLTQGAPGPNLPNLEVLRNTQPTQLTVHTPIRSNLPCSDCNAVGEGAAPVTDQRFSTARTRPENETGQEGVDLGSRNLNWSLPILSLPGRAGLDLSLTLTYNSLVWTQQDYIIKYNADRGFPAPGFRIGFPVLQPRYLNSNTTAYAFMLVLPSGRRISMQQVGTSNTYESSDSTYTQMEYYPWGVASAVVRSTDGTQLMFQASVDGELRCNTIKDRNGNFITVYYDGYGHPVSAYDTLYRQINFNYDADHNLQTITQGWSGGPHTWATFYYGALLMQPNFTGLTINGPNNTYQTVLTRVVLEDQSYYDFGYTNFGQIWKITRFAPDTTPLSYASYNLPGSPLLDSSAQTDCPRFTEQRVWAKDWNNNAEALTTYDFDRSGANGWTEVTMPDRSTRIKEFFSTATNWQKGLTTLTEYYSGSTKVKWTTTNWTQDDTNLPYQKNPRPSEINVYDAQNNRRRTVISYTSQFGLPSNVDEYASDAITILRRTHTDYEFDADYINRRIIGLPTYRYVYEGTSTLQSKTGYFYDWWASHYEATPQPAIQHDSANYGLNLIRGRGNLVMELRYDINDPNNAQNTVIEHKWGYNITGSLTFTRDQLWHQTFISYADSFSDGANRNTYAYPTRVTDGDGYQSFASYNYEFGARTRAEGPPPANQSEGLVQEMSYDVARRITRISTKVGNAEYYYKRWVYLSDGVSELEFSSVNALTDDSYYYTGRDGAGNVRAVAQYHPGSAGSYSGQYFVYDVMDRVVQRSNPTEINVNFQAYGDDASGWQWTQQQYDWKGRPTVTTLPGGATVENTYGGCGCAGGEQVTTRDERGRRRTLSMDVLGRVKKAEELNWDQSVYATTTYDYNARDQLKTITQGNRVRSFDYDGYGRLWKRTTPEQGQVEYNYNADDTVQWFKDARGAKTMFVYNNRHMVRSLNYDISAVLAGQNVSATPNVTYEYDAAGNRIQMVTGQPGTASHVSTVDYAYDSLSRMTSETVQFPGVPRSHTLTYGYNRVGELTSLTNPFNSTVSYTHDRMGRISNVNGSGDISVPSYVSNVQYRASGAPKQVNYGNTRTLTASYDNRLRLKQWNIAGVLGYDYSYTHLGENSNRVTFAHNITTTQSGSQMAARDASLDRSYEYDQLGRLTASFTGTSALAHTGQGSTWGGEGPYAQTYSYDQWGNQTARGGWGGENASYTASFTVNNRMSYNPLSGVAMQFDASGNLTYDNYQSFTYYATGQQATASGASTQMHYDGDRLRVKKVENGATSYYIRSSVLGGQIVADLGASGQWIHGYLYMAGQLMAYQENGRVLWVYEEPVTKAKRTTDTTGAVHTITELDPWGGETGRSYWSGLQPHKYTTYERDANGSDEAMHRRYNRWWSRFDQPDPYDDNYDLTDPQSLNRYSYTQNDPVNFVDPSGLARIIDCTFTYYFEGHALGNSNCDNFGAYDYWWGGYSPKEREVGPEVLPGICDQMWWALSPLDSDVRVTYAPQGRGGEQGPYGLFNPLFAAVLSSAIRELNSMGIVPQINSDSRTYADQAAMRAGGSGNNPAANLSLHQGGFAVDFNGTGTQQFKTIRSVMGTHGFTWGGTFNDPPHFESNLFGKKGTKEYKQRLGEQAAWVNFYLTMCSQ